MSSERKYKFTVINAIDRGDAFRREVVEAVCDTMDQALEFVCDWYRRECPDQSIPTYDRARLFVRELPVIVIT